MWCFEIKYNDERIFKEYEDREHLSMWLYYLQDISKQNLDVDNFSIRFGTKKIKRNRYERDIFYI